MKKQWYQFGRRIISNGKRILCNYYPCDCPPIEDRPVIYAAKGGGWPRDGSSPYNGYHSIQEAVDNHPKAVIIISSLDTWTENVVLPDCAYLKGDGNGAVVDGGIIGPDWKYTEDYNTKIENIATAIVGITYVSNCHGPGLRISACTYVDNCSLSGKFAQIYKCDYVTNCIVEGNDDDETMQNGNTVADWAGSGFYQNRNMTNCTARNCIVGFSSLGATYTDCLAENNEWAGFRNTNVDPPDASCYTLSGNTYWECDSFSNKVGFIGHDDVYEWCRANNNLSCGYRKIGRWCSYPDVWDEVGVNSYNFCNEWTNIYEQMIFENCLNNDSDCIEDKCIDPGISTYLEV